MVLDTFDIIMTDIRLVRLRARGGHILTLSIADRRPVQLRADGLDTFDLIMMDIRLVRLRARGCPRRRLCSALLAGQSILHADGWGLSLSASPRAVGLSVFL